MVRALASKKCVPGLNTRFSIKWVEFVVTSLPYSKGFSLGKKTLSVFFFPNFSFKFDPESDR